jgi:phytoene dehydrogenase-like protein
MERTTAAVIGSGPNGLAAAILLARTGYRVKVFEQAPEPGGGLRSAELTLPGFVHDFCSAVHPMAIASPFFERLPLRESGLEWIHPDAPLAHPLDDGTAVLLEGSLEDTSSGLGRDGEAWRKLFGRFVERWEDLRQDVLAPLRLPRHPALMARFGLKALAPARSLAEGAFAGTRARALFAGMAAHSVLPLEQRPSAGVALALGIAGQVGGWPLAKGESGSIAKALVSILKASGGEIHTGAAVTELPEAEIVMADVTPRQLLAIAGARLPRAYSRTLARWRYGPAVFKLDWALSSPIPWRARECRRAATVHVGGSLEEIAAWERSYTGAPFIILVQPTLFDPTRAPEGKHTAWGYCHVPNGWAGDLTDAIEGQVERFAPGFRETILARRALTPTAFESHNPNLVGGDISGGAMDLRQLFLRPSARTYITPVCGVFICSASTPPGGGVHGMCGYHAVRAALGQAAVRDALSGA